MAARVIQRHVAGLPFALLAVADPYTSLTAETVTYPGRRIAIMIDASDSMQAAFKEHHGLQCGFCTPGMVIASIDMVNRLGKNISEETIRHELEGNICRCTGYHNIVAAVKAGAANM